MVGRGRVLVAVGATLVVLVAAGCSSTSKSTGSAGSVGSVGSAGKSGSTPTVTIGVLADLTGPAAGIENTVIDGIKAGIGRASQEGYHIKYVSADAATSPTGALTAAQRLVEKDHVFAVFGLSALLFSASSYLKSRGMPVIGAATDGPEWTTSPNMFPLQGAADYNRVFNTIPLFWKMQGATNLAALGYGITPSSSLSTKAAAAGAQSVGLKVGYLNANFPFGSTNVGPAAIAIKSSGADALYAGVVTSTSFALINALRQNNAPMKAEVLPVGYGGDLFAGGEAGLAAAKGVFFTVGFEPVEMRTAATEQFQNDLRTYAGITGDPTSGEYVGYLAVDALVAGLKATGANLTQTSFINAMHGITNYNGAGLYGNHSVSFGMAGRGLTQGADNCLWFTQFNGKSFDLVTGADPLCGSLIPGKTVS
jgi:ABC-type branched-subunit amino acid transport system substrate-binding protein